MSVPAGGGLAVLKKVSPTREKAKGTREKFSLLPSPLTPTGFSARTDASRERVIITDSSVLASGAEP
jgi:hypothetical protein